MIFNKNMMFYNESLLAYIPKYIIWNITFKLIHHTTFID